VDVSLFGEKGVSAVVNIAEIKVFQEEEDEKCCAMDFKINNEKFTGAVKFEDGSWRLLGFDSLVRDLKLNIADNKEIVDALQKKLLRSSRMNGKVERMLAELEIKKLKMSLFYRS
jgi:hypothetical protein